MYNFLWQVLTRLWPLIVFLLYTYSAKSCVHNSSYTSKGSMLKRLQMDNLIVKLYKKQSIFMVGQFLLDYAPWLVFLYTHIMEYLLCAKLLALNCLILTPIVGSFRCPVNKPSLIRKFTCTQSQLHKSLKNTNQNI